MYQVAYKSGTTMVHNLIVIDHTDATGLASFAAPWSMDSLFYHTLLLSSFGPFFIDVRGKLKS